MRLVKLAIGLFILLLLPFLLWGRGVEELFTIDGTISWLRGFGVMGRSGRRAIACLRYPAAHSRHPCHDRTRHVVRAGSRWADRRRGVFSGGHDRFSGLCETGPPCGASFRERCRTCPGRDAVRAMGRVDYRAFALASDHSRGGFLHGGDRVHAATPVYRRACLRSCPARLYFCYCWSSGRGASRPDIFAERFSARGVLAGRTPENAPGNIHELNLMAP